MPRPGTWARACFSTSVWPAAVFDPALPGRNMIASAGRPVVGEHAQRVEPEPILERRGNLLLVRVGGDQRRVHVHDQRVAGGQGVPGVESFPRSELRPSSGKAV